MLKNSGDAMVIRIHSMVFQDTKDHLKRALGLFGYKRGGKIKVKHTSYDRKRKENNEKRGEERKSRGNYGARLERDLEFVFNIHAWLNAQLETRRKPQQI